MPNSSHWSTCSLILQSLTFNDLALLYQHCAILEYKPLLNRIFGCLKGKLYYSLPTIDGIKFFQANISELYTFAIHCLAKEMVNPWTCNYAPYLELADVNEPFGHALGSAMQKILAERIKIGEEYYRHTKDRRVLWSKTYLDKAFIQRGSKLAEEKPIGKKSMAVMSTRNINMVSILAMCETKHGRSTNGNQSYPTILKQKSESKTRKPSNCFKCGKVGHIARNCTTETTARHPATKSSTSREPNTIKNAGATNGLSGGPTKQKSSKCFKCGRPGHGLRKCTLETSLNVTEKSMVQVRDMASRNKNYRRAQRDRVVGVIEVKGNGEGLKTCDREVKIGEMTRTGLIV